MWNLVILTLFTVSVGYGHHLGPDHGLKSITNIVAFIAGEGYPVQNTTAKTSDGYLLDLIRIPGTEWDLKANKEPAKKIVLLMHGLLGSADEFVAGGRDIGIAFKLADRGFDVFMGSARGSKYGRKHTTLNPDRDPQFWRFSWDEIGLYDLPAIMRHIHDLTGKRKLHYIGYNEGTTAFYVMASKNPEMNDRIVKMIAIGPMVYMKNAHHPLMNVIRNNRQNHQWIVKNLGKNEFLPSDTVKFMSKQVCLRDGIEEEVCDNIYFLINGYSRNLNRTLIQHVTADRPYGTSVRQLLHYAQIMETGKFASYDDDNDDNDSSDSTSSSSSSSSDESNCSKELYDLKAVTASNYLLFVPDDDWCDTKDVQKLASALPNVKLVLAFPEYSANVDLLFGKRAKGSLNDHIFDILM